jgi:hypothetical protein
MNKVIDEIKQYGVPAEAINVFSLDQLKVVFLLLDHGRLSAEQVENLAENLKDAEQRRLFS